VKTHKVTHPFERAVIMIMGAKNHFDPVRDERSDHCRHGREGGRGARPPAAPFVDFTAKFAYQFCATLFVM